MLKSHNTCTGCKTKPVEGTLFASTPLLPILVTGRGREKMNQDGGSSHMLRCAIYGPIFNLYIIFTQGLWFFFSSGGKLSPLKPYTLSNIRLWDAKNSSPNLRCFGLTQIHYPTLSSRLHAAASNQYPVGHINDTATVHANDALPKATLV